MPEMRMMGDGLITLGLVPRLRRCSAASGSDNSLMPKSCSIANINSLSCANVLNLLMCTKSP